MRTTLKAQAIRLIAVFLLITASTTTVKAQISQHNTTKGSSTGST